MYTYLFFIPSYLGTISLAVDFDRYAFWVLVWQRKNAEEDGDAGLLFAQPEVTEPEDLFHNNRRIVWIIWNLFELLLGYSFRSISCIVFFCVVYNRTLIFHL